MRGSDVTGIKLWCVVIPMLAGCWSSTAVERPDAERIEDGFADVAGDGTGEVDQPRDDADAVVADATDFGEDPGMTDALSDAAADDPSSDEATGPDGGCTNADDCDDCIDCTIDSCDSETGECRHAIDPDFCLPPRFCEPARMGCWPPLCATDAECDDGDLCNGAERCGVDGLCLPGTPVTCDDGVACTVDTCDPGTGRCTSAPPDRDLDTYLDGACGGTDCDDTSPTIHPGATEACNGLDEDCDTAADEDLECIVGATRPCATWCSTEGTQAWGPACRWGDCRPPPETCNCVDDDCNLLVDETCACERVTWRILSECRPWRWPEVLPAGCRPGVIDDSTCFDAFVPGTAPARLSSSSPARRFCWVRCGPVVPLFGNRRDLSVEACTGSLTLCLFDLQRRLRRYDRGHIVVVIEAAGELASAGR